MSQYIKITLVSFILSAICWFSEIVINPSGFEIALGVVAIILSLIFVCFLVISIAEKFCKKFSPYRIFAIVDSCIGVCVAAYAIYGIETDTGWFAGLVGFLLLVIVMPIIAVLLLADFIVWILKKRKNSHR